MTEQEINDIFNVIISTDMGKKDFEEWLEKNQDRIIEELLMVVGRAVFSGLTTARVKTVDGAKNLLMEVEDGR